MFKPTINWRQDVYGQSWFKRLVLSQFSCGLKHSFALILKLRRDLKKKRKKRVFIIHFQPSEENPFTPKSKDTFYSIELYVFHPLSGRSQRVLESTFSPHHLHMHQDRNKRLRIPSYLPQSGSKNFDTSLSAFQESQRGEDGLRGWHLAHTHDKVFSGKRPSVHRGKVVTPCVFVSWGPPLRLWPKSWRSLGKPQTVSLIFRSPSCGAARGTCCTVCLWMCITHTTCVCCNL